MGSMRRPREPPDRPALACGTALPGSLSGADCRPSSKRSTSDSTTSSSMRLSGGPAGAGPRAMSGLSAAISQGGRRSPCRSAQWGRPSSSPRSSWRPLAIASIPSTWPISPRFSDGICSASDVVVPSTAETVVMKVPPPARRGGAGGRGEPRGLRRHLPGPVPQPARLSRYPGCVVRSGLGAILGITLACPSRHPGAGLRGWDRRSGTGLCGGLACARHDPVLTLCSRRPPSSDAGIGISLLKVLADPYNQLPAITFWLLGSLASATLGDVASVLPALVLGSCRWCSCAGV